MSRAAGCRGWPSKGFSSAALLITRSIFHTWNGLYSCPHIIAPILHLHPLPSLPPSLPPPPSALDQVCLPVGCHIPRRISSIMPSAECSPHGCCWSRNYSGKRRRDRSRTDRRRGVSCWPARHRRRRDDNNGCGDGGWGGRCRRGPQRPRRWRRWERSRYQRLRQRQQRAGRRLWGDGDGYTRSDARFERGEFAPSCQHERVGESFSYSCSCWDSPDEQKRRRHQQQQQRQ